MGDRRLMGLWRSSLRPAQGDRRGAGLASPAFQTCVDCGTVARKFETTRRRVFLTFTHRREVAHLPPAEADALLDWCEELLQGGGKRPRRRVSCG